MQDRATCVVSDDGIVVCCCLIFQAVEFGDSVGGRFVLLSGDIILGREHGRINCLGILQKCARDGLDLLCPKWV